MAFLTMIPNPSNSIFRHKNGRRPPLNSTISPAPDILYPRNTWSTTTSAQTKQSASNPLKPYESFCDHIHIHSIIDEEDTKESKHANMVKNVRRLIAEVNSDEFEDLIMVDALQRLAIDYHFKDEINLILTQRYMQFNDTNFSHQQTLYEVSLCFRLLRQIGFNLSADVFMKFKGKDDKFGENLNNDLRGLIELYEASQISIEGEVILEEAQKFCRQCLEEAMKLLDDEQVKIIRRTLDNPYHKTLPFFNFNNFISDFNGTVLQELAELEFNMKKTAHKMELMQILRWWSELSLGEELKLVRNQPVSWFIGPMASLTNLNLSSQRIDITKTASLVYIIDDLYDVYSTIDEVTIFTESINRWDTSGIEQLPSYMKTSFMAVYDHTNEISNKMYEQHGFNPINSLRKAWATLCNNFLVEAKWFASGYIPKAEEYLENGMITSGVQLLLIHIFFLLGDAKNEEDARIINDNHGVITSVSKLSRLWDDLGTAEDEKLRGHDVSYIKYFLNEHKDCTMKDAEEHVNNLISDTWKRLNKDSLSPNPFSDTFIKTAINTARMLPLMASTGDHTASRALLKDYVKSVLYM